MLNTNNNNNNNKPRTLPKIPFTKTLYIGADHAGFKLKSQVDRWLTKQNLPFVDLGNSTLQPTDDYPDFALKVATKVAEEKTVGVLLCGSAQGMCIAANKIKGVRAVVPFSLKEARLAREHNDANIICLSGWYHHLHKTTQMLEVFLSTSFSNEERHIRRLKKIESMENRGERKQSKIARK